MEMEKCGFPEAIRLVAEKCGIAVPPPRERSPEERRENQQRTTLVKMHSEAAAFFARQLETTAEGKAARAYLEDRGLDQEAIARFGLGYAPSGGDVLLRAFRAKYAEKLLGVSGLFSTDASGRLYDRFRRRIMFPIANESGKVVAFGGRSLGDDMPKYLNSSETPIYSKGYVLYNLHRAKEALREIRDHKERYIVLVEGYVDCIRVDAAKIPYVVASCGTSLTEAHVQLLRRFASNVVVWYDMDSAGRAATDRSLELLLSQEMKVEVYWYKSTSVSDPDTYIRNVGSDSAREPIVAAIENFVWDRRMESLRSDFDRVMKIVDNDERSRAEDARQKKVEETKSQRPRSHSGRVFRLQSLGEFLMDRAKEMFDLSSPEGKLQAMNFLMPYIQRIPNRLLRSEWATKIAEQLRIEEPVLRESLKRAAAERRSNVQTNPELVARAGKPAERRLIQLLIEADDFRQRLAEEIRATDLHRGLETEQILAALVESILSGGLPDPADLAANLDERHQRLLFEIAFESGGAASWEEAESCLGALRRGRVDAELAALQKEIEVQAASKSPESSEALRSLLQRKQELTKLSQGM